MFNQFSDPVFYKSQITKLLKKAEDNNVKVFIDENNRLAFRYEWSVLGVPSAEQASVDLNKYIK